MSNSEVVDPGELFELAEDLGVMCLETFGDEVWKSSAALMIAWAALVISTGATDATAMRIIKSSMPATLKNLRGLHDQVMGELH